MSYLKRNVRNDTKNLKKGKKQKEKKENTMQNIDLVTQEDLTKVLKYLESISRKLDEKIEKKWLSTKELAEYTSYKINTIQAKIKTNQFIENVHYYKKGGKLFFDRSAIDRWIIGIYDEQNLAQLSDDKFSQYLDGILTN